MGLTKHSVGMGAMRGDCKTNQKSQRVLALAGNPNVGKSTVFNALTGMHQHTGNWPGKTVAQAVGNCKVGHLDCTVVDTPGTYSLLAHSAEEEVARSFICFGDADAVMVVCDATCPERSLHLALQIMECGVPVLICMNLMDEAKRKQIRIDLALMEQRLGVPVIGCAARNKKSIRALCTKTAVFLEKPHTVYSPPISYPAAVEEAVLAVQRVLEKQDIRRLSSRWLSLKLLENDAGLIAEITEYLGTDFQTDELRYALEEAQERLSQAGIDGDALCEITVSASMERAEMICRDTVKREKPAYSGLNRSLDRFLTGKYTAYPLMLLFLALIFWLTITASNYPSTYLSKGLFYLLDVLREWLNQIQAPPWLCGLLVDGILGVLAYVISVMLPPMAIFFPLFTLLEDVGYLPRIAYNLDRPFQRCHACGKQALTMCMGFGCNAAGVVGCRIIDSPRERLLAILTNSFVPCNGRFPSLIAILTMFFIGFSSGLGASVASALLLSVTVLCGILATFLVTRLLSATLLRGIPSSFTLELPPYRPPQVGKIIVRSLLDRTLFVLGRSVAVAAPAGLVIWTLANISVNDATLLSHCAAFLNPFASLLGMDGVILMAFILGFPANEAVIPIMVMAYLSTGKLTELETLAETKALFLANGWTWTTAVCVLIFFLFHWPCSTTLLTVKKETGSWKWTALAAIIPTLIGMLLCMLVAALFG